MLLAVALQHQLLAYRATEGKIDEDHPIVATHNAMASRVAKLAIHLCRQRMRSNSYYERGFPGRLAGLQHDAVKVGDVIEFTTVGPESFEREEIRGKKIAIPLMYVPHGNGVIIVGSQGGAPKSPVWVKSVQKNPQIVAQYMGKRMNLVARQVSDEEKARLWPVCVEHYHEFDDYQARTDRNIPVFDCQPAA